MQSTDIGLSRNFLFFLKELTEKGKAFGCLFFLCYNISNNTLVFKSFVCLIQTIVFLYISYFHNKNETIIKNKLSTTYTVKYFLYITNHMLFIYFFLFITIQHLLYSIIATLFQKSTSTLTKEQHPPQLKLHNSFIPPRHVYSQLNPDHEHRRILNVTAYSATPAEQYDISIGIV